MAEGCGWLKPGLFRIHIMTFVEAKRISKHYGDVTAVDEISFTINEGEFVSILGPSGSGKTTTLRMLAGFEDPDEGGEIIVDGESVVGRPPEDREMSMVFQDLALFPHLTVKENIAFGLQYRTTYTKQEIQEEVSRALELVELPGYQDRAVSELSGGEQQRVALARAIVVEPKVLLYDEPLSNLDRQLRENMRREISELHENLGITSLYVTHNQREALTLADRIFVMRDGNIVQTGPPSEIYNNPTSEFVADFVGDSNFLSGEVSKNGSSWRFVNDQVSLALSNESELADGQQVTMYVRPEDMRVESSPTDDSIKGSIVSSVHLGSVTEYNVRIGDSEFLITELGAPKHKRGEEVNVRFNAYNFLP